MQIKRRWINNHYSKSMIHQLEIREFLEQSQGHLALDVRSEGEYDHGRIPGVVNLPLFNNHEREIVGTAYKQKSRREATLLGLDFASKKMSDFVRFIQPRLRDNKVFVHCWRGGMRSESMAWLFNLFEHEVFILQGGYKSFRNHVLEVLDKPFNYLVLGGRTGSGKTAILQQLKSLGEQVIDLEGLAHHKGSAFGGLGQLHPQPSNEQFENLLATQLKKFDLERRVWVEDESRSVGKVLLPELFWKKLLVAPSIIINLPLEVRVQRLKADYGENEVDGLRNSINNIKKRLGPDCFEKALCALEQKDFAGVAQLVLGYYDKLYDKGIANKLNPNICQMNFATDRIDHIAKQLQEADLAALFAFKG